jgi:hypothetical protein
MPLRVLAEYCASCRAKGDLEPDAAILQSVDAMNNTFLHEAAYAGNVEAMREALEDFKIRVTATNATGNTAIHHLMHQSVRDFKPAIDMLVAAGGRLDVLNQRQQNILHICGENNNAVAAEALLEGILTEEQIVAMLAQRDASQPTDSSRSRFEAGEARLRGNVLQTAPPSDLRQTSDR